MPVVLKCLKSLVEEYKEYIYGSSTNYLNLNENNQNSVSIFPNPSENYIYIRYENISPESYKIFDVNGRLIYSKIINNNDDLLVAVT